MDTWRRNPCVSDLAGFFLSASSAISPVSFSRVVAEIPPEYRRREPTVPLDGGVSGEDGADVGCESEGVEEGEEGEQRRVPRVAEPRLYRDRVVCNPTK